MRKTTYLMIAMTVVVVLFASGCGGAAAPAAQPPAEAAPTQAPVQSAPTQAPAEPVAPAAAVQTFAPACQAAASCTAPAVTDTIAADRYCVDKVPYQNILVDEGVTFQVLEPDKLTCNDNGTIVDGKHVVECYGTENWASQVKFMNTACGNAGLQVGTGQCQEGQGYDAAQNCCAPFPAADAGSVTITVNMGECPN
jgi:hypothetical protein